MTQQFTASEVRDLAKRGTDAMQQFIDGRHTLHIPPQSDDADMVIAECLRAMDAFADLLEAREKAVPVAYAEFADNGCVRMWSRGYEERLPRTRMIPVYLHPASPDAERLEEQRDDAFQQAVQEARRVWMDEFPCEAGHDHVTPFDQFLYGNLPCMEAQPPAASAPIFGQNGKQNDAFRAKAEAELEALKARIADGWLCGVSNDKCSGNFDAAIYCLPSRFRGKRVRLLVEE